MTNLYLIRHGEAVSNVEPIIGGMRGDTGLTARGVLQAERLRDRLAESREVAADVLIASTLPRARQTAEIIAPALDLPIVWDDEVQEMRPGAADGLTIDQFREKFGIPDYEREPFRPLAPGGENWPGFMLRVGAALDRITRAHEGKTIVVVCHGGFIDGSFVYFFALPSVPVPRAGFNTHNTSLTNWEQQVRSDGSRRWRLVAYNDAMHLRDIGAEEPVEWREMAPQDEESTARPAVPVATEGRKDR